MEKCYHTTTKERIESIMTNGLVPNSKPMWYIASVPYIQLSKKPWKNLNGSDSVVLEITDPSVLSIPVCFWEDEGLRYDNVIKPKHIKIYKEEL